MGISIAWDNEERSICRIEFKEPFNWGDYDDAIDSLWATVKTVDHTVDIIGTLAQGTSLPKGLPLKHLQRAAQTQPSNVDFVVMVEYNPFVKALIAILVKLNPTAAKSARFASSLEKAYTLLEKEHQRAQRV